MCDYQLVKNKLINYISSVDSKRLSHVVKQDTELFPWVSQAHGKTIAEKIYNLLNPEHAVCSQGNVKIFKSLAAGYGFCGKPGVCFCAKQSVSKKVSSAKLQYSDEIKQQIQQKKKHTVLSRYGVENVGLLEQSKQAHQQLYQDCNAVKLINQRICSTKKQKYSDSNFNNSEKTKETFRKKRNDGFWIDKFPEKNIQALEDRAQLYDLYTKHTPAEISELLNVHIQTVYKYLNQHQIRSAFKSADEEELVRFVQELGITNIVRNTRKLLPSKKEIDIYLPDLNIAIEYNGVYWHHEDVAHITRDYHYRKFIECEQLGIQLITIFSNFWHNKKEIVKNILRMKLRCYAGLSVYARKCTVKIIDSKQSKQFLNQYHIQGYTPATICLGLFNSDELVAVMTFSKNRIGIGKQSGCTELVRFASLGLIVGAASKLLCAYRKQFPTETIISYSDNEWSTGAVYQSLGFFLDAEVKHSYWYLKPRQHQLMHRFNFSKQKLIKMGFDPDKTESQITKEMGLLKVWDCGKRKWKLAPE